MAIVVDTSIIISVVLNEYTKHQIIQATKGQELIAPSSLQWEIGNAFSAMFKRKRITLEQAISGFRIYIKIPIRYPDMDFDYALKIAYENNIYAYDAYFISLSKKQRCPFLTLDKSLQEIASNFGVKVIEVNDDDI